MPSSVVAHFNYDEKTSTLRVKYISGMVYDYKNVPEKVYREMKAYQSKGSYLNDYIKGKYDFEKVDFSD